MFMLRQTSVKMAVLLHKQASDRIHSLLTVYTVTAPIMDAACTQKLFFGRWPRLVIKSGFNSKNIF